MKVSVCGCGWLGLPLAKQLVLNGYQVYGSSRDQSRAAEIAGSGIHAITLVLPVELQENKAGLEHQYSEFFKTDTLVINIPPGRGDGADKNFIAAVKSLSAVAKRYGCKRVIFISATSVYGSVTGEVEEVTAPLPDTASGHAHFQLEQWLHEQWGENVVVLRLAGLIGPGRHPVKYLAGRKALANGSAPVNLVHLDDCIQAIEHIITCWPSQKLLHLSAPAHPSRQTYYTKMALAAGLPVPEFLEPSSGEGKVINAKRTCEILGLTLIYPDLMVLPPELPHIV